jgi:hypothetical protein
MISKKYWERLQGRAEETRKEFELPATETSLPRSIWKWIRIVFWMILR